MLDFIERLFWIYWNDHMNLGLRHIEDRLSGYKDKVSNIEKVSNKDDGTLTRMFKKIWDNIKKPNLRIIGFSRSYEDTNQRNTWHFQWNSIRKFLNLKNNIEIQIQDPLRTQNGQYQKGPSPRHIIIKISNVWNMNEIFKSARGKCHI